MKQKLKTIAYIIGELLGVASLSLFIFSPVLFLKLPFNKIITIVGGSVLALLFNSFFSGFLELANHCGQTQSCKIVHGIRKILNKIVGVASLSLLVGVPVAMLQLVPSHFAWWVRLAVIAGGLVFALGLIVFSLSEIGLGVIETNSETRFSRDTSSRWSGRWIDGGP